MNRYRVLKVTNQYCTKYYPQQFIRGSWENFYMNDEMRCVHEYSQDFKAIEALKYLIDGPKEEVIFQC